MKKNKIVENAIELIDPEYVKNAVLSLDARQNKKVVGPKRYYIVVAIAAAILLAFGSAWILHSVRNGDPEPSENASHIPSSKETEFVADSSTDPLSKETERTASDSETTSAIKETEDMEGPTLSAEIKVNWIRSEMNAGYRYYSASIYDFIPKSLDELSAYFGKDLTKIPSTQNYNILHTTEFIYTKDERMLVFDVSHIVYEGDSNTISVSMSRMMRPYDCFYLYDNEQYSIIGGLRVLIGENVEGTHALADFETGGIFYRIQMNGTIDLNLLVRCITELVRQ